MTNPFAVCPIVEGYGDAVALPVLLRRLVPAIDPARWPDVKKPIRVPRSTLLKREGVERYVELAARVTGPAGAVLILVDADDDCAATLGPELLKRSQAVRSDQSVGVALAVREFETWFLASAASLGGHRNLAVDLSPPPDPEAVRDAKGWLQGRRTDRLAYRPTVDQAALAAAVDLVETRRSSPSFDKLWREVERLMRETAPS